jgi:hypothetical protein
MMPGTPMKNENENETHKLCGGCEKSSLKKQIETKRAGGSIT